MKMRDQYDLISEMIKSVDPSHNRLTTAGKANEVRAAMGSYRFKNSLFGLPPLEMLAICGTCGWRGTILNAREVPYDNGAWANLAGRRGYHWYCPICADTIWKHYTEIN